ncbi:MAG: Bug family tripartite tricarboxylate transporter substrate binding protein [Burkholderiales bacterium]
MALVIPASAQNWPEKPSRIVLAGGAGTLPDVIVRVVAEHLAKAFGRPFIVENLVGGAGLLAPQAVARAAPDGYSYFFGGVGFIASDKYMFKNPGYDADKEFVPVALLYDSAPFVIAVHPDLPVKSVPELIALAKAQPGKLSYGADTIGATALAGPWFTKVAGVDLISVPYKSIAQMIQDSVAGTTNMVVNSFANVESFRRAGKLRVIGITSSERSPALKDVPTVAESLPGFKIVGVGIMAAPAGTPAAIVQRVNREIDILVKQPDYVQRLLNVGITSGGAGSPQSITEFIRGEREIWDRIMKGMNVQPQ